MSIHVRPRVRAGSIAPESALAAFEEVYRANAGAVTAFFARRCTEPQIVADLTSEAFVEAIASFDGFDTRRGSPRAWLLGIARHVYAQHCAETAGARAATNRLAALRELDDDAVEELATKIDAERTGRELMQRCARLAAVERAAIELVDLAGLTPKEAARVLSISPGALRVRLFRARARLRKEQTHDEQL